MHVVLVIVAVLVGLLGAGSLSPATMGVGIVCGGCLLAILARIAQASAHHAEQKKIAQAIEKMLGERNIEG